MNKGDLINEVSTVVKTKKDAQAAVDCVLSSITTAGFHETVTSRCRLPIRPELQFPEIIPTNYQAFVLSGGFYSQGYDEAYNSKIHRLSKEIHQNGGYIQCVSGFYQSPMPVY